jgi:hypothetical protein
MFPPLTPRRRHLRTPELTLPFLDLALIALPGEIEQGMGFRKQELEMSRAM